MLKQWSWPARTLFTHSNKITRHFSAQRNNAFNSTFYISWRIYLYSFTTCLPPYAYWQVPTQATEVGQRETLRRKAGTKTQLTVFHAVMFCIATAPPPTDCQGPSTNYLKQSKTWTCQKSILSLHKKGNSNIFVWVTFKYMTWFCCLRTLKNHLVLLVHAPPRNG